MTVRRPGRWTPAAWVLLLAFLVSPGVCTFSGPFPGPDNWADVPPATRRALDGREVVYTLPARPARGVLVFLHGHMQRAYEWGFPSATCINCTGLPEEMVTVYQMTQRGYAILAFDPYFETAGPDGTRFDIRWPPESYKEVPTLVATLKKLLKELDLWQLPRYVMGSSAGSHLSIFLASRMQFQGVGALLVGLKPEMCRPQMVSLVGRDTETGATWAFPPTLFLSVMLDHQVILQNMKHTISYFLERGVILKSMVLERRPIAASYFAERIIGMDLPASKRIHEQLRAIGAFDDQDYIEWTRWEAGKTRFVREASALNLPEYQVYKDQLARVYTEAVFASQAAHEQNSGPVDDILDFFEATTPGAHCAARRRRGGTHASAQQ